MDRVPVANLEAELACFEQESVSVASRPDHGDSDVQPKLPPEAISRLDPASTSKCVDTFGLDGTLAWTTPAGELLHIASCVDNKMIGVDYKKSIERGPDYSDRGKMLSKALESPQGAGYGIGISILGAEPHDKCWVVNRWPRYEYRASSLDVTLQYYIHSGTVIQEHRFQNTNREDTSINCRISSDICFREHTTGSNPIYPVSTKESSERLLLFQNTEVLMRNKSVKSQFKMALFLNGKRHPLWESGGRKQNASTKSGDGRAWNPSDRELAWTDERLLRRIFGGQLVDEEADSDFRRSYRRYHDLVRRETEQSNKAVNFASHDFCLFVPADSTQVLRAVFEVTRPSGRQEDVSKPSITWQAETTRDGDNSRRSSSKPPDLNMNTIRAHQRLLVDRSKQISLRTALRTANLEVWRRVSKLIADHLELGRACAMLEMFGEARYHLFTACLISERLYRKESYALGKARLIYATFLNNQGWNSMATNILEKLLEALPSEGAGNTKFTVLRHRVQIRLGAVYLEMGRFSEAENMYQSALPHPIVGEPISDTISAHCVERIAWAQVQQQKHNEATKNYFLLLKTPSMQHHSATINSNLGFIAKTKGKFEEAMPFFRRALGSSDDGATHEIQQLYARSGLYNCLAKLDQDPEGDSGIAKALIQHVNFTPLLLGSPKIAFSQGRSFQFAMARQLETLLSTCSIPVQNSEHFKLLTQFQNHIIERHEKHAGQSDFSERIKATCQGHLLWASEIAQPAADTWSTFYSVGGESIRPAPAANDPPTSRAVEGAFHFSKLWLYLSTWSQDWELVLELLHSGLGQWLAYLRRTQHMANLWVERDDFEVLRPYDTISPDNGTIYAITPQYHLSDFTMLWLALKQIEKLIESIESAFGLQQRQDGDPLKSKVKEIRQTFTDHQKALNTQRVRSNIIKTFIDFGEGTFGTQSSVHERNTTIHLVNASDKPRITAITGVNDAPLTSTAPRLEAEASSQDFQTSEPAPQTLAFRRTVGEHFSDIQPTDVATIEAAMAGFFESSNSQIVSAWQENFKLQLDHHIPSLQDPRKVALILLAAKSKFLLTKSPENKIENTCRDRLTIALYDSGVFADMIEDNAPIAMREWSANTYETMSILLGGLFQECRLPLPSQNPHDDHNPTQGQRMLQTTQPATTNLYKPKSIVMPRQVGTSTRHARKNVIDSLFQPDWVYHYPAYIHEHPLQINVEEDTTSVESFPGFKNAIKKWRASKKFSGAGEPRIFLPHVADSGTKKGAALDDSSGQRQMDVNWYGDAAAFYKHLVRPRTFGLAKKRLIELASHEQELALICWLTIIPGYDRTIFLDFLRRHGSTESFFGERVDWKGNIWDTELHLGFYQLLTVADNKRSPPPHLEYQGQFRIRKMPSLSQASSSGEITPVAISLRFVGDLRDRSWTCHFFTSAARDCGFTGLVDEFTDLQASKLTKAQFYVEKIGQRKLLELAYVERILQEMGQSCDSILKGFLRELDVPETRDPQSESYEFIHNYSRLHSKTSEILRDVLKQLDLALRTIEDWEKREDSRDIRSRWSQKDEDRYGKRLAELTRKCKINLQQLKVQRDRLEEQQKLADQRHSNLINYMSLQTARTSSQSAEDVRLFTYVTIIFLPLSFSSSLFSMQGAPQGSTVSVMAPTTVIALAITILALANMKVLDRNLNFWAYKLNANARKKMGASKHPWGIPWSKISSELEQADELRLAKPENEKHLPFQSNWWYLLFWISYTNKLPKHYLLATFHAWEERNIQPLSPIRFLFRLLISGLLVFPCVLIFAIQLCVLTAVDAVLLIWRALRWLAKTLFTPPQLVPAQQKSAKKGHTKDLVKAVLETTVGDSVEDSNLEKASTFSSASHGHSNSILEPISRWLQTPPRPIKVLTRKIKLPSDAPDKTEPRQLPESEIKVEPLLLTSDMFGDSDGWDVEFENRLAMKQGTPALEAQPAPSHPRQRNPSIASYKVKPPWWRRWKNWKGDGLQV
ncbi:MAG: hypothetical protein Q9178_002370 [Gyalolechia marmorata]